MLGEDVGKGPIPGTLCPEKTQESAQSLFGKASIWATLCILVSSLSLGCFQGHALRSAGKDRVLGSAACLYQSCGRSSGSAPATWIQSPELTLPGCVTLISVCPSFLIWFLGSPQNLTHEKYSTNGGITGSQA